MIYCIWGMGFSYSAPENFVFSKLVSLRMLIVELIVVIKLYKRSSNNYVKNLSKCQQCL